MLVEASLGAMVLVANNVSRDIILFERFVELGGEGLQIARLLSSEFQDQWAGDPRFSMRDDTAYSLFILTLTINPTEAPA